MQALVIIEAHGKVETWSKIAATIGLSAKVIPTNGHMCRFPNTLFPIGINLSGRERIDQSRRIVPEIRDRILAELMALPQGTQIIIATDNDVEGDVIALDVMDLLYAHDRSRIEDTFRLRPAAINKDGIKRALRDMKPASAHGQDMIDASVQGRARAVTDRWIGAAFSKLAGIPVGRVRSAILGSSYLWAKSPGHTQGLPETGEITMQVRSGIGGRPFQARIALNSDLYDPTQIKTLAGIATRFSNRFVPGVVRPLQSLSAAVAPRIGNVSCFNTGDALTYAARHFGVPPKAAMQGLQDAYMNGMISYPRTDQRDVSPETATRVASLGSACGFPGIDPFHLSAPTPGAQRETHEGLHPVIGMTSENTARLGKLIRRKFGAEDFVSRAGIMDVMIAIVTRRSFEAGREIVMTRGSWSQSNVATAAAALSPGEVEALRGVEWLREDQAAVPWGRDLMTGLRPWPQEAMLIEGMMIENIGRPSTFAAHVDTAMSSGDFDPYRPGALPRPSPQGMTSLKRTPRTIWNPMTCRTIEQVLENKANFIGEDDSGTLNARARTRVLFWLQKMPADIQQVLKDALAETSTAGKPGEVSQSASVDVEASSPMAMPDGLAGPAPSWA